VAQAVVRAQAQAPAGARGQVVPGLVGVLAVVVAPVVAVEDLAEAVELALAAAGRELVAAVAEAPVRVAALEAQELAVADPVAEQVWAAEPVVAAEKQHPASG
jgi:hypothetical protein